MSRWSAPTPNFPIWVFVGLVEYAEKTQERQLFVCVPLFWLVRASLNGQLVAPRLSTVEPGSSEFRAEA